MLRKFSMVMAAVAFTANLTLASTPQRKDLQVFNDIANTVNRYTQFTIYDDVNGSVRDGVVTLTGKVTMPYQASEIGDLVARVPGVREVDNTISTLPVSPFDDQLRIAIASQIYRDPPVLELCDSGESADSHGRGERPRDADRRGQFRSRAPEGGKRCAHDVRRVQRGQQ